MIFFFEKFLVEGRDDTPASGLGGQFLGKGSIPFPEPRPFPISFFRKKKDIELGKGMVAPELIFFKKRGQSDCRIRCKKNFGPKLSDFALSRQFLNF